MTRAYARRQRRFRVSGPPNSGRSHNGPAGPRRAASDKGRTVVKFSPIVSPASAPKLTACASVHSTTASPCCCRRLAPQCVPAPLSPEHCARVRFARGRGECRRQSHPNGWRAALLMHAGQTGRLASECPSVSLSLAPAVASPRSARNSAQELASARVYGLPEAMEGEKSDAG